METIPLEERCQLAAIARGYRLVRDSSGTWFRLKSVTSKPERAFHEFCALHVIADALGVIPHHSGATKKRTEKKAPADSAVILRPLLPVGCGNSKSRQVVIGLFIWPRIDDQRQRSFVTGYRDRPPGFSGARSQPRPVCEQTAASACPAVAGSRFRDGSSRRVISSIGPRRAPSSRGTPIRAADRWQFRFDCPTQLIQTSFSHVF